MACHRKWRPPLPPTPRKSLKWCRKTLLGFQMSSEDLVERPSVPKAAIPDLVYRLRCLSVVFALRSCSYRESSSPLHAILVVICELENLVPKELIRPSAFSTQGARSDFSASHMPQILRIPINLESQMIIRMHHFHAPSYLPSDSSYRCNLHTA